MKSSSVAQVGRQDLERDEPVEAGLLSEVDVAHPAGAELLEDRVALDGVGERMGPGPGRRRRLGAAERAADLDLGDDAERRRGPGTS